MRYSICVFQFENFRKHLTFVNGILKKAKGYEATVCLLPNPCNENIFFELTLHISLILFLPDLNVFSLHSPSDV